MRTIARIAVLVLAVVTAGTAWGSASDDPFFAGTEKFAKGAKNVTEVTLDQRTLQMASGFIGHDGDRDTEDVKRITANLKGVFVRSYEYDSEGQYSMADLEEYRKKLDGNPQWAHIVKTRELGEHGENADVYMLVENGKTNGIVVISAEPRELTFVHIDGQINPEDLNKLKGSMGIPGNSDTRVTRKKSRDKAKDKSAVEKDEEKPEVTQ